MLRSQQPKVKAIVKCTHGKVEDGKKKGMEKKIKRKGPIITAESIVLDDFWPKTKSYCGVLLVPPERRKKNIGIGRRGREQDRE